MRVLRHVAPWWLVFGLLACDDATNISSAKADLGGGGSFGGSSGTADAAGGGGGRQGSGGDEPGDGTAGGAGGTDDALVPSSDAHIVPKPDGNLPERDAGVDPPDPDSGVVRRDGAVVDPPDGAEPRRDAQVVFPPDGAVAREDAAVPPADGGTPPGMLRLSRARIVWSVGSLGTGQALGSTQLSRNGFLRLTGRVLFAAGGQQP